MTGEKYVVLCDCGKPPAPYCVAAWIDDNRTDGGSVDVYATKLVKSFRLSPNRDGGMHGYKFGCPQCGKMSLNLAQDTVAKMIDTLLPSRHMLEVKDIPVPPRNPDSKWTVFRSIDEFEAHKTEVLNTSQTSSTVEFSTVEQRYVIPIKVVRRYVNELKKPT